MIRSSSITAILLLLAATAIAQEPAASPTPEAEYFCVTCHAEPDMWEGEDVRFLVTPEHLKNDVHWQSRLRCHDCHGGDPTSEDFAGAHSAETGFSAIESPKDIPGFCGKCHSNIEYMRRFLPSPRTDQEAEYWTSGHGVRLAASGDPNVATCTSCHGHHGIRAVDDLASPVYPTRVAETCGKCHADAERMKGYEYHGRPLGHDQLALWKTSVHGRAMLEKNDIGAPTCNDCHGNHGAVPPEVGSVANACGTCHGRVAELFRDTSMKHRFEEVGLPGCATCHGYHDLEMPSDRMLGMGDGGVCVKCHADGKFGATLSGTDVARTMRSGLEDLKRDIAVASDRLDVAERLGMEVRQARFDLTKARGSLTNARTIIHGFSADRFAETIAEGREVVAGVERQADEAMIEHRARRIWLAISLLIILAMIGVVVFCIRRLPLPATSEVSEATDET